LSELARPSALAPFRYRNYRFQWPADLLTSWAFEMETLILGWYVLVETGSVLSDLVLPRLSYVGTADCPVVRRGRRAHRSPRSARHDARDLLRCWAGHTDDAALTGHLEPLYVLVIVGCHGPRFDRRTCVSAGALVRPSCRQIN